MFSWLDLFAAFSTGFMLAMCIILVNRRAWGFVAVLTVLIGTQAAIFVARHWSVF